MDNPYVQCPYNKEHRVSRSRLQQHLVKCEKRYPPLMICPYNATHRYPEDKFKAHVANCPSKQSWNIEEVVNVAAKAPDVPERSNDSDDEVWDD